MTAGIVTFRSDDPDELTRQADHLGISRSEYIRSKVEGGGAWVVGYHGDRPHSIHPTEIEALRELASGYGQFVKFWPWGPRPDDF